MNGAKTMQAGVPNDLTRRWSRLAMVWALYYVVSFTLGQNPHYMQNTIWLGAGGVGLFTVPLFWKHIRLRHLPREGVLLGLFLLWALTGGLIVTDMAMFTRYLKLLFELMMIVIFVSLILKNSGAAKWFFLAYLSVAVLRVFYGNDPINMEQLSQEMGMARRIDSANSLGFHCALGILAMLALWGETKSLWGRTVLAGGGALALYGVVLSASRTAFLALMLIAILWPTLCLVGGSRLKMKAVVGAVIALLLAYWAYQFIIQETNMGVRFMKSAHMEDNSTRVRLDLVLIGLLMFVKNPLFGCGLGQFGVASGTGFYAHNEVIEILATTGLPGFCLYYSAYWIAWRRLSWSLKYILDPLIRYRINIARMALLVLLISGALATPNFLGQNTMFLLGIAVGMAHWAEQIARQTGRRFGQGLVPGLPAPGFSAQRPAPGWGSPRPSFIPLRTFPKTDTVR